MRRCVHGIWSTSLEILEWVLRLASFLVFRMIGYIPLSIQTPDLLLKIIPMGLSYLNSILWIFCNILYDQVVL